ncbi:MAG: helix-turn-helix domain-containing protein [Polyangiales bacterium]
MLSDSTSITAEDLDLSGDAYSVPLPLSEAREEFSRQYVLDSIERNGGNRTKAALELGVDPRTVFRYLERATDAPNE